MEQELGHLPVMLTEVILALSPHPGSFQIDATVGGGGHASRILEAANPDGRLLGIDADPRAIERSERRLARYGERVTLRRSNFEAIAAVAAESGFGQVDGILMDLGVSSQQLDDETGASASDPPSASTCASTRRAASRPARSSRATTRPP